MSRKVRRVPYHLDPKDVRQLSQDEIRAIIRGAEDLITNGGRSMLAKILKGSRDKKLLENGLDDNPVYGYYNDLTLDEITARIDRAILDGYLDIYYDYRLPLLVFTREGLLIAEDIISDEHLVEFDEMIESGQEDFDMSYLKDLNRSMILQLLDKVGATGDPKYIPLLEA
jgi:superfamily II DNA helicase RecQ